MKGKLTIIATYGEPRRRDRVRVVKLTVKGEAMVRVQWKEGDRRKSQAFPDTRKGTVEAKAYASAKSDKLAARVSVAAFDHVTVRALFEKHINAKVDSWRPRSLETKKYRWGAFELFVGKHTPAHLVTREQMDEFKRAMVNNRHSVNQVKLYIENAKAVFRWGVDRDLIPPTKVATYKIEFGRDAKLQVVQMAEYTQEEREKILAQLNPRSANQWRAWALTQLFALCGPRQNAARYLEWSDVTLDGPGSGRIRWRSETDKMGTERVQPLPAPVAEAMWVALGWRQFDGYTGRFVFYGARKKSLDSDRPYGFQAYGHALHGAERRAGIPHLKYRASHAFRRGISGDIYDLTGSEHQAAEWIGDKSVKVVKKHYLLERRKRQEAMAKLVGEMKE